MKATKCDRCGRFFTINEQLPYIPVITPSYRSGVSLDLCNECINSFNDWLHTDYYFDEQVKLGHAIPESEQYCFKCAFWDEKSTPRKCSVGRAYRPRETICDKWKPK